MTPEGKVKSKVSKILSEHGVVYFMPRGTAIGKSGVSDYICVYHGRFIAIEAKAGKNKPTALQQKFLNDVVKSGGISLVINEDNLQELTQTIICIASGS